jgi:FMN reductase
MMRKYSIVALSGSPSPTSKTARLADHCLSGLGGLNVSVAHVRIQQLDPRALIEGKLNDPGLKEAFELIESAHGIVVATPIFKASFSGLLKLFIDCLPQFALVGKVVFPLATGGSVAHVLALDYALRPVLQSMGARHIVQSLFVPEASMQIASGSFSLQPDSEQPLQQALRNFRHSLTDDSAARDLGHPRPEQALKAVDRGLLSVAPTPFSTIREARG